MLSQRQRQVLQKAEKISFYEKNHSILDDFWQICLDLARVPTTGEFDFSTKIRSLLGSMKKAHAYLCDFHSDEYFQVARQNRIEDLNIYFALSLFGGRKPYKHIPDSLKRDVKEFFGDYSNAKVEGKKLLFSVGKPNIIHDGCEQAANQMKIGFLDGNHSLQFHVSQLNQLPPALRVYVGCATHMYGDVENADLIKIHIRSGKVTLLKYDDFIGKPLLELQQRVKIKLREQSIDFFDYGEAYVPQPLYLKSRYSSETFLDF